MISAVTVAFDGQRLIYRMTQMVVMIFAPMHTPHSSTSFPSYLHPRISYIKASIIYIVSSVQALTLRSHISIPVSILQAWMIGY